MPSGQGIILIFPVAFIFQDQNPGGSLIITVMDSAGIYYLPHPLFFDQPDRNSQVSGNKL